MSNQIQSLLIKKVKVEEHRVKRLLQIRILIAIGFLNISGSGLKFTSCMISIGKTINYTQIFFKYTCVTHLIQNSVMKVDRQQR